VGRGPRHEEVRDRVIREGLANVRLIAPQPRAMLSQTLGAGDVHLTILQPQFESLVVPSKIYGIMAAGRPNIFVGDPKGESAHLLAQTGAGLSVPVRDDAALASTLLELRRNPVECQNLGTNARRAFDERFDVTLALQRWDSVFRSLM
jgi:colanic acid biosynthesis glycosyl transferase WcaI